MIVKSIAILFSITFERSAYYGLRLLIVLYMTQGSLGLENEQAFKYYGMLAALSAGCQLIGGLFGDFVMGHRWSTFLGALLQAIGAFCLMNDSETFLIIALMIISLGAGFYRPNILAKYGKVFLHKKRLLDSGFSALMLAINVGATVGVILLALIQNELGYKIAFAFTGVLYILSALFIVFVNDAKSENVVVKYGANPFVWKLLLLMAVTIFCGLYWASYSISYDSLVQQVYELFESQDMKIEFYEIDKYFSIPLLLIATVVFYFIRFSSVLKILMGFGVALAATLLIFFLLQSGELSVTSVILISLLTAVAETLTVPFLYALVSKYASYKYMALIFAVVGLFAYVLPKSSEAISGLELSFWPKVIISVGLLLSGFVAFLLLYIFEKDKKELELE